MLTKKDKTEIGEMVVDVLNTNLLPVLNTITDNMATKDEMVTKDEFKEFKEVNENRFDTLERKVDRILSKEIDQDSKIADHQVRIQNIESSIQK